MVIIPTKSQYLESIHEARQRIVRSQSALVADCTSKHIYICIGSGSVAPVLQRTTRLDGSYRVEHGTPIQLVPPALQDSPLKCDRFDLDLSTPLLQCYQCDTMTTWLAPDSRCGNCTRLTLEEIKG